MTKVRQPELFQHYASPLFKNVPAAGRDDSPVSVIAHSAVISHPSSACTSMDHHHMNRDAKLQQLCHEHDYSTSEDDAIGNNLALSQDFLKVRSLESLPETHSFPSRTIHGKSGWLLEDPHQKVELSLLTTTDNKSLSSETDSTASGPEVSDESSGEHFLGLLKGSQLVWNNISFRSQLVISTFEYMGDQSHSNKANMEIQRAEDGEASMYFSPSIDGTGVQEKPMVVKADFRTDGRRLTHEDIVAEHEGHSAKLKHREWQQEETSAYGQSKESLAIGTLLPVSKDTNKSDWKQLKLTDPGVSINKFAEEVEEGPWKKATLQGIGSCVAKTASSPGLAPMGGSFPGVQNLAGCQINQGVLDAWRVSSGPYSVRALPNYACDAVGRGYFSRTLPSKWEDAEKWLVSVDSPSHTQLRNAVAPSKPLQFRIPPVNRNINTGVQRPAAIVQAAKPADYSFSSDEIGGATLNYNQSATATASDSELPKALEYRALVRSGSQKYRRKHNYGGSSCGTEAAREEVLHNLRSYGGDGGNGTPKMFNDGRDKGREVGFNDPSKEKWDSLMPCNFQGVQALGSGIGKPTVSFSNNDNVGERALVLQPGALTEILTQDKYADSVVKALRRGGDPPPLTVSQEYAMLTSSRARSASMKDASTEISPAVSRRDMATQVTPEPSSCTSRCSTPVTNNSPPRHNTPARQSASWNKTGGFNLLELESFHLEKLEHRDLPVASDFQSFDNSGSVWSTREEEEEESSACLRPPEVPDNEFNLLEARATAWEDAERAKFIAKCKREEAKIDAWENLQKAKAEAEIRKLEVKLQKLRSQATEKIMNKLTIALRRAQEMRAASELQEVEQLARLAERAISIRKNGHFPGNLGVCFARMA